MAYRKSLIGAVALSLSLTFPAFAQDETPEVTADTVVATVDGVEITIGHMIAMRLTLSEQNRQLPDDVLFQGILERIIQQRAVSHSVDNPARGVELAIENERAAMIASRLVNVLAQGVEVSEEALQEAYDTKFAEFEPTREFNASHILVETEEEAQAIIEELDGGADFAALAMEKSTGPSGASGGVLGWFGEGMMVTPFQEAVAEMEVGTVSAPVQTQFGWHVIKLNETRLPEAPSFESVREDLQAKLWEEELRAQIAGIVDEAEIVREDTSGIDPSVLRDSTLIDF